VLVTPVELVSLPQRPVVDDVARAVADTGFSRFPVRAGAGFSGYLHVKDILDIADDPGAEVPSQRIRRLPQVRVTDRLDVALAVLRRAGAHLGRAVDAGGATAGLVTLEDLIEHYVGTVRDATHAREEPA
jgi:magnesium and cobalt exporter, CNNM family